jgi:hypothetical protein
MQAKVLNLSYKVVFELCREAIFKSNFNVECVDENEGYIICFTRDLIEIERLIIIRIKELSPYQVEVEVESRYASREYISTYEKVDEKIFIKHLSMIFK